MVDPAEILNWILGKMFVFVQEKIQKTKENQGFLRVFGRKGLAFSDGVCYSNTR